MQFVADLHIHSKYSRAVSPKMNLFEIAKYATKKGIQIVSTGDWTHPLWFKHLSENLVNSNEGLYTLKGFPNVRYILTTEISSIYSQGDKVRRIHNLVLSPSLETCEKVIKKLKSMGANLMSDGRPIVGITSKNLIELLLEIDPKITLIPCHIWTPWFSLYGSRSGFDSIEECYGKENSKYIYGIETGLSSDPVMNWQIKELETRSILSSSDAHSGPKLGREATVFVRQNPNSSIQITQITYLDVIEAIKQNPNSPLKIGYTIEFFPEEGKYHWSGHRACNIRYDAFEVKEKGEICPVCKKSLTIGVENRVFDLSSKKIMRNDLHLLKNKYDLTFVYDPDKKRKPFVSIVPLLEVLTEIHNGSPTKALTQYEVLTLTFASEFDILLKKTYDDIEKFGGTQLRNAIAIMRNRKVFVDPGYDGVFGIVKIFNHNEKENHTTPQTENQQKLF